MGFSFNPLHDISSALHAGERLAGKALHAGEKVAEDGAKGFASAMKDAAKAVTHMSPSEIGHTVLNVAGMIPVIGTPADAINAGWMPLRAIGKMPHYPPPRLFRAWAISWVGLDSAQLP
jgi:hypothetical protein